ncbi:MAG TPA: nuclear transport factor 2 family protein [Kofleriaceae bacterium]|nr:nuclear transport factor 2 family protein [Kofleriaceae bacterium]
MPGHFDEFREKVRAATLALMNGDREPWAALWSRRADVSLFGGWGGHERGWDELAERWKMVEGRYRSGTVEIERITEHIHGDLAVTVEFLRSNASFSNGSSGPVALRVTHVCRREDGEWRLVHRHADEQMRLQPIDSHLGR